MEEASRPVLFEKLREIILEQYQKAQILEADRNVRALEELLFPLPSKGQPEDAELKPLRLGYLKHKVLYDTIKREADEVRTLLHGFQEKDDDWEATMEDANGTRVMWRPSLSSPIHTIRLDGKLKIPVFNILSVLMEVDLYLTWVPVVMGMGMRNIKLISDMDRFRKLVAVDVALPWPIADRDCNLVGYGVDLLDQGRVLAVARSYDCAPEVPHNVNWSLFPETEPLEPKKVDEEETDGKSEPAAPSPSTDELSDSEKLRDEIVAVLEKIPSQVPPVQRKIVRAKIHQGGFLLTPISENETEVSFLFQVDPDLAVVPTSLINWGMKHFSFTALSLLGKAAAKVGTPESPYTKRMVDKPQVYEYLSTRLAEFANMTQEEQEERKRKALHLLTRPSPLHPHRGPSVDKFEFSEPTPSPSPAPQASDLLTPPDPSQSPAVFAVV